MSDDDDSLTPVRLHAEPSDRSTDQDLFPFQLGDDDTVLVGTRPKVAVLIRLTTMMADNTDPMAQVAAFDGFLDKVLDKDSAAYLRARMEDDDDDLDLDHPEIELMFKTLIEVWYGARPTGGRRGSPPSSRRTGKRSTVRSRSAG